MNHLATTLALLLCATEALAQKVGASMALEGRAAIVRAAQHLTACQQENGLWLEDEALTALAAEAILKTNAVLQDDPSNAVAAGKALATVRRQQASLPLHKRAIALRVILAAHDTADAAALQDALSTFRQLKPPLPASTALWLADAIYLTADAIRTPLPATALSALGACHPSTKPEQLALALATGNTAENAVKALYSAARKTPADTASFTALYWLARSCQACNSAGAIPYDGWKADIITALLERQRGNGAWTATMQTEADDIRDTALAIQTILLCLLE